MENNTKGWHWNKDVCYAAVKYDNDGKIVAEQRREYVEQALNIFDGISLGTNEKKALLEVSKDGTIITIRESKRWVN